ncbi:PIN domain-containing protein [Syntrophothermus lipocalidus]|uniref:PIN domain-containing protein n=1 Tax=Syntrophothermus lipocalidus TaxID=86170 RepID=UPI001F62083E|nr:PIN domain-containing protein [Syntrophothermus lipocalidus]
MDANVILSALIGGKAIRVFIEAKELKFVTTDRAVGEVREYIPVLAKRKSLSRNVMEAVFSLLELEVVEKEAYLQHVPTALELIGRRDPDDADLVALALALNCPVWTNDNDLVELKEIKTLTTAEILCLVDSWENG